MYYVKDGGVWKVQRKQPGVPKGRPEKVADGGFEMDTNYIYFVDRDGDVARAKRAVGGQKRKKTAAQAAKRQPARKAAKKAKAKKAARRRRPSPRPRPPRRRARSAAKLAQTSQHSKKAAGGAPARGLSFQCSARPRLRRGALSDVRRAALALRALRPRALAAAGCRGCGGRSARARSATPRRRASRLDRELVHDPDEADQRHDRHQHVLLVQPLRDPEVGERARCWAGTSSAPSR